jgi:hypothetical protein
MPYKIKQIQWATARLLFISYISFSVLSVFGGFLTAPAMTWYFFGDWRFWRHWSSGKQLLPHSFKLLKVMFRDRKGFMFSVPLTSPPRSVPDPDKTALKSSWGEKRTCGNCTNCCRTGGYACPLLDESRGLCQGHDSFYWRYFNCGRFPSVTSQVEYYECPKWVVIPVVQLADFKASKSSAGAMSQNNEECNETG